MNDDEKKEMHDEEVNHDGVTIDDCEGFANMINGHGADGHTLAHWCAKRGKCVLVKCFFCKSMKITFISLLYQRR